MHYRTREPWHTMKIAEVERRLKTSMQTGLSHKVCRTRLERFGRNDLFSPEPRTVQSCARRILTDPALLVLVFIALIALCFGRIATALTVLFVLGVGTAASIVAYVKTSRIKEEMSAHAAPSVHVKRAGQLFVCAASELVPGDMILLTEGDVIPCDARLVASSRGFVVMNYTRDEQGQACYVATAKSADALYDGTTVTPVEARANMVYAGSTVKEGQAVAIVTETGEDTYIVSEYGLHPLAMQVGDPLYLSPMRKYMNKYSLWMCALVLPCVLIGIFAGKGSVDVLDTVLLTLALVASAMSEQVISMGRIICAASVIRAAYEGKQHNAAVLKNYAAIDRICRVDELFIYGKSAISDGKLHPYAAYTAGSLFLGEDMKSVAVKELYEMVYYYEKCAVNQEYSTRFGTRDAWQSSMSELGQMLGFDSASANIRTVALQPLEYSPAWVEVTLRQSDDMPDRYFRVHCCDEPEPILQCNACRMGKQTVEIDTARCKLLYDIFNQLKNQGTEVCAYIREEGGLAIFEGILSFREAYAPDIPEVLRELEQSHVRVSLFLPEEGKYHLNYLIASGWIDTGKDAVSATKLAAASRPLADVFDKKRVFFGFTKEDVAAQIERTRAQGKTVAVLGIDTTDTDVRFACEALSDSDEDASGLRVYEAFASETDTPVNCRRADVLIHRAGPGGGGLGGVLNAVYTARSIHFRMMLSMQYLLVAQLLRMIVVLLPLLFGNTMISPALLLMSGVWIDLGFVGVCAFHHCSEETLRDVPDFATFFKAPLRSRPDWVTATAVSGLFTVLTGYILTGTHTLAPGNGLGIYAFLSLLAAQSCLLICLLRTSGPFSGNWRAHASSLLVLGIVAGLVLLTLAIPPVAAWFGGGGLSLAAFLLALLSPLYLIGGYFLSMTYRHKLVRLVRVYFRRIKRQFGKKRKEIAYTEDKSPDDRN